MNENETKKNVIGSGPKDQHNWFMWVKGLGGR